MLPELFKEYAIALFLEKSGGLSAKTRKSLTG
jgi:hypothetical protein